MKPALDVRGLFPELDLISDDALRASVEAVWQDAWQLSSYASIDDVWVYPDIEYPQIKHSQALVRSAVALADLHGSAHGTAYDLDALIAGALLADVSKLVEFENVDGKCVRTSIGLNLPHPAYAVHMALTRGIPLDVVHIIASHSPLAGVEPRTREAQLVYWLDQADLAAFSHSIWSRRVAHVVDTARGAADAEPQSAAARKPT